MAVPNSETGRNGTQTGHLRPETLGSDTSEDGKLCIEALQSMLDTGASPYEAFEPVLAGVKSDTFLITTKPSYRQQLTTRYEALLKQQLPPMAEVD